MAAIDQLRVAWTGLPGMPGVSTFYTPTGGFDGLRAAVHEFFTLVKTIHPTGLHWTIPNQGLIIDEASGEATGVWVGTGAAQTVDASHPDGYHGAGGWVAEWRTGRFVGGREIRGKTFMVPLCMGFYDLTGTLNDEALVQMRGAADALAGFEVLSIYSPTHGVSAGVTAGEVPDMAVVLKTRRDN